jgi:hypothetical protein
MCLMMMLMMNKWSGNNRTLYTDNDGEISQDVCIQYLYSGAASCNAGAGKDHAVAKERSICSWLHGFLEESGKN